MKSKIASIILAAGASTRFGSNKFLAKIRGQYLLERTIAPFLNHGDLRNELIVVTGYYTDDLKPLLKKMKANQIHNPSFNEGMSSSIQAGYRSLKSKLNKLSGIIIHPGDIPYINIQDLERLISSHKVSPDSIVIPKFNSKRGHPIIIPKRMFSEFDNIGEYPNGLRDLIRSSDSKIKYVNINNQGILEDIDTKKDLDELSHLS